MNVEVTVDKRQLHVDTQQSKLAAYLEEHPERIPDAMAVIERLLTTHPEELPHPG